VNRRRERAEEFVERMSSQVTAELKIAASPEAAVRESAIVTTITGSREPVLLGKWLQPGTHVNLAGGNMVLRREADSETIMRADRLVVDSTDQARTECGEFVSVFELGRRHWDEVVELKDVVVAGSLRKTPEEITLFKSLGIGLEDVALGRLVYERAKEHNVGRPLDM
jgi:ornithine cyclodeaminase/alanine dehydrogenase-like protein (mu-crystallin family)